MDKITQFEPDKSCSQLHNKLVPFFQTVDLEMSTTELVDSFIGFLKANGLNVIGRVCTITIEDMENIGEDVRQSLDDWQKHWVQDFMEPLTIIHDNKVSFHFPPICVENESVV